jgi:Raf kinase inhibitor-like YbhB/YbcL family protein
MSTLKLTSQAFSHSEYIPARYTCDGPNVNPPLTIENIPPETKSLALIFEDPDAPAGTWVHWVVWNISPATREIKEQSLPSGAQEGMNDFRKHGYGGPCPPSGTHRYFFKLYALNTTLSLIVNATKSALEIAMKGRILSQTEFMGLYKRK